MPNSAPRRVAVVEDALRREGYEPQAFDDGLTAWESLDRDCPDLIILDIGLPRMDGLDLCRRLRTRSERLPIIFVTSREEEFDRVLGLEIGADDYLCKPFSMRELMVRVKVLLRRSSYGDQARELEDRTLALGDLEMDPVRLRVTWKGRTVPLTVTEFLLLHSLVNRPGAVKTREQLMDAAYPDRVSVSDRTIDSHVKRIRRKFTESTAASRGSRAYTARGTVTSNPRYEHRLLAALASFPHRPPLAGVQPARRVRACGWRAVPGRVRTASPRCPGTRDGSAGAGPCGRDRRPGVAGSHDARAHVRPHGTTDRCALPGLRCARHARRGFCSGGRPGTRGGRDERCCGKRGHDGARPRALSPWRENRTAAAACQGSHGAVTGAVVVSQSTFRILRALYDVRLRVFTIVVASLVAAFALTLLAATTVVEPLTKLRRQAATLGQRRGPLPAAFPGAGRTDEIGDLARALEELTRRTSDHIALLQSFAADVTHELKNPLASIRTAAEMMASSSSEEERRRFLELMTRDVDRLERLVSGLREVALVEGQMEQEPTEPFDVAPFLAGMVEGVNVTRRRRVKAAFTADQGPHVVRAARERLAQVFENLIANAVSFTPEGTTIDVQVTSRDGSCVISIDDRGPGIPEAHLGRVFDRFFSYRPGEARRDHVGLGLAIASQIVESYGGGMTASNRQGGGARFEVRLPLRSIRQSGVISV